MPSVKQLTFEQTLEPNPQPSIAFNSSVTAGDYLLAAVRWRQSPGTLPTISDSQGNTWIPIYVDSTKGIWYAVAKSTASCIVTFVYNGTGFPFNTDVYLLEIQNAASIASAAANGSNSTLAVSVNGVSISVGTFDGLPTTWGAAMVQFTGSDGSLLNIAVLFSDGAFVDDPAGANVPNGWTNEFPASSPSWSEILSGGNVPIPIAPIVIHNPGPSPLRQNTFWEVEFPTMISFKATGGPGFSTNVNKGFSGLEQRNRNWAGTRGKWNVSLITPTSIERQMFVDLLNSFFSNVGGKADGFRFQDAKDHIAVAQPLAVNADGAVQLAITRTIAGRSYVQFISKPITSAVLDFEGNPLSDTVFLSGTQSVVTVDETTGIVSGAGAGTLIDFEYDYPVRFDVDELSLQVEPSAIWDDNPIVSWSSIPLIEVLPPDF